MGKDLLNEFVNRGWLDRSVTEGYDPYYEPEWLPTDAWDGGGWDGDAGVPGEAFDGAWL